MNKFGIPSGTVVVGVDGSRQSRLALGWAVEQAAAEHRELSLAHAVPPLNGSWLDPEGEYQALDPERIDAQARSLLEEAHDLAVRRAPDVKVHDVVRVADPRQLLLDLGGDAAMVVLGSRGRGPVRSLLLGSVGVALVRHAPCPVVVHRPGNPGIVRQGVVAGVDGTQRSEAVLEFAYRVAAQRDLPLTVIHSYWDVPPALPELHYVEPVPGGPETERLALAEVVAGLGEKYPEVRARTEVVRGATDSVLGQRGERANLLVLGTHHGGLPTELLFGSVTTDVVEHATCPVAVVPVA